VKRSDRRPIARPDADAGLAALREILVVSRETEDRLRLYADLLVKWQPSQNLVSPTTLPDLWRRHIVDSAQAFALRPEAKAWVDLGSGAGFPGLVTAILGAPHGATVDLMESNTGKAAFLRTVARETGVPVSLHVGRIEELAPRLAAERRFDVVTARALAPLAALLALAKPFLDQGAAALFHKGQDFVSEIELATQSWGLDLLEHKSRVDRAGRLLEIRSAIPLP
jgi:16S rRNA (guanine527-N7)-methyltransferase